MTERRTARRYDLSLPIIIRVPAERALDSQLGKTRDISTRGLYFVVDQNLESGSQLDITLTLPAEITHGSEVFVRAQGKVVRVERRMEDGSARMGVAAVIERYDIIRGEAARAVPTVSRLARIPSCTMVREYLSSPVSFHVFSWEECCGIHLAIRAELG